MNPDEQNSVSPKLPIPPIMPTPYAGITDPERKPDIPFDVNNTNKEEISSKDSLQQIRTYQGDVASALHNQQESLVSIQRAEASRNSMRNSAGRNASIEEDKKSVRSGILLLVGIVILFGLGAGGGYLAYKSYKTKTAVPVVIKIPNAFFSTDTILTVNALPLNRDSVIQLIQKEKEKRDLTNEQIQLKKGALETDQLLSTEGFLGIIQSHAPASLVRAFNPLFMLGTLGRNEKHTFLIIRLDSFENAYPRMLEWEASMGLDLLPLFQSTEIVQAVPSDTPFEDVTIQNKDSRVLKDSKGQTILLYTFFDNNMIIIADNEETLKTIITRLTSEKLTR